LMTIKLIMTDNNADNKSDNKAITGLDRLFRAPRISRQSVHESGKVISPTLRQP
jgi:hypothetical protein